jgi:PAS domain S-box-containing protein
MKIDLDTGSLTEEQIHLIFDNLPVGITFADENDQVVYYNKKMGELFTRKKENLNRTVQECHAKKSVPAVNKILDSFRSGEASSITHLEDIKGKKIMIQYIAVRNSEGKYVGCLEVVADLDELQDIGSLE